ncbi:ABC transporter ATP-binding protein [Rhodospirillum sp. A1_3_36]|uniref:ABC transporter ATP-binding protein n=1 Tax=Rhodospirillum sp. A1_3_36 TaxID=3391666 RepID=UPI0039A7703C
MSSPINHGPPLLEVEDLEVHFNRGRSLWPGAKSRTVRAVNGVSLTVRPGETIGLVGESGSGKSTFGRAVLRLETPTAGSVLFEGVDMARGTRGDIATLRRRTAMIFQDPYGSLNPRMTIGEAIAEVLRVHRLVPADRINDRVGELLTLVGLEPAQATRKPGDMSGGQCQRAGIARALAIEPRLIIADECVAALDVSIQGQIINLLMELRARMGLAMIFIAHDLAIVRHLCDRVAVMYLGRIVEEGPTEAVFTAPRHPYTASLIAAIPDINPDNPLPADPPPGDPPSPVHLPPGCPFHPRCAFAIEACSSGGPPPKKGDENHWGACLHPPSVFAPTVSTQ